MFCPKCGSKNPDIAKFCKNCGRQMPDIKEVLARTQQYQKAQAGLVGQTIEGKYRIDAKLGSGGMGDVYRAKRLLIGDDVAIKTLHTHLANDLQAAERFKREARTATRLQHKNVIKIYDVGMSQTPHFLYILMELAKGYTLRQIINEKKTLPLDFAVTVIAQVCAALTEAHQLGIIHRDIKPENIIADQTETGWHIKVLDFGIAKLYNQADLDLTQDGSALGTPQYMSPEQCLGEQLGATSDIYSIGITIYELLCGRPPFTGLSALAISHHQIGTEPPTLRELNPDVHPDIEKVILKALSKKPENRQQTAKELATEFIEAATVAFLECERTETVEEPETESVFESEVEEKDTGSNVEEVTKDDSDLVEKEDMSQVFEEAEQALDNILDDKKQNDQAEVENNSEQNNTNSNPIPKPNSDLD